MDLITLELARKYVKKAIAANGPMIDANGDKVSFDTENGLVEVVKGGDKTIVANYSLTDGIDKQDIMKLFTEE